MTPFFSLPPAHVTRLLCEHAAMCLAAAQETEGPEARAFRARAFFYQAMAEAVTCPPGGGPISLDAEDLRLVFGYLDAAPFFYSALGRLKGSR